MNHPPPLAGPPIVNTTSASVSNFRETVWLMWGHGILAALIAHLAFLAVFLALDLPLLVWINVASVAIHLGCRWMIASGRHAPAVVLLVAEVLVHAGIATRVLGPDSGFQFYVLTLVLPLLIILTGSVASKLAWVAAVGVYYCLLDAWTHQAVPFHPIDPRVLDALRYFNLAGMLVIMAFVSLTYNRLVRDAERALRVLATTDPLTGLNNRRRMLDIAQREHDRVRHRRGLCVMLCDIDHFKSVNDTHGHEVGDRALQTVGQVLSASLREHDFIARWGGEEFLALVIDADESTAAQAAERMRRAVADCRVDLPDKPALTLTGTIGVARLRDGETIDVAIARADTALYVGKAAGRNRVSLEPAPHGNSPTAAVGPPEPNDAAVS